MKKLLMTSIFGLTMAGAPDASAASIVYQGSQQIGTIDATYTLTTDGTLGVINASNVTDYTVSLTHNGVTTALTNVNSGLRGSFTASDVGLSLANESQDFHVNSNFAPSATLMVGYSNFIYLYNNGGQSQLVDGTNQFSRNSNAAGFAAMQVTSTPAVPEPATWALMLVGFGMVGGAARYRRHSVEVSLA